MLRERLVHLLAPRYLLGEELAGGGMARVFAAHEPALDRAVVIKVLPPERASATAVERFRREARLLARLSHPHVVPVLESGDRDGLFWFVMPRVAGQPLDEVLRRGPLEEATVRRLGVELLDALAHAHALGVVHRDVKPANVLLHADHAILADFGVALLRDSGDDTLTESGQAVGTLAYMAPEQQAGGGDARSDLWSLGATLYEAATGTRWDRGTTGNPRRRVSTALEQVLRRALAAAPEERWPDAATFRAALVAPRARPWLPAAGMATVVAAVSWWVGAVGGPPGGGSGLDSVDIAIVSRHADAPAVADVARQASLLLQWFPRIAVALEGDARPARIRVELEDRLAEGHAVLAVVGTGADGTLVFSRRVSHADGDGRDVARTIVAELFRDRLVEFDQLGQSGNSVQGWRAFWVGLEAFQAGRFAAADIALTQALRHDTSFAAAAWVRSLAQMWERVDITSSLERLGTSGALPPPIDVLVAAQRDPDIRRRLFVFDSVVAAHPHYAPARMLLANELFHRGPIVGVPLQAGVDAFRAARIETPDLDHVNTAEQLLWGAIRIGDEATARSAVAGLRDHPDRLRHEVLLLAFDTRFQPMAATVRGAVLRFATRGPVLSELGRYLRFGLLFDLPALQRRLADQVVRSSDAPLLAATAMAARATALLMEGRPTAALEALARTEALSVRSGAFRTQHLEWRLLLPLLGMPVDPAATSAAAREAATLVDTQDGARLRWALAVSTGGQGPIPGAGRWNEALSADAGSDPVAAHLARLAAAYVVAAGGNLSAALESSAVIEIDPGDDLALARGPLARAVTKFQRGRWRLALGDTVGALAEWRWVENNDLQGWPIGPLQEGELDAALSPLVRLHRAVLLCAAGDRPAGRALTRRVETLWRRAEAPVRALPVLREARERCR